jgi:DNA-binding transcriptional LysR family regulator
MNETICNDHFMNEMMLDWDDLRLFLAVARLGGLSAAATATGKSAPTLGRRMLALERRLGQELFERTARGYALTPDGEDLLASVAGLENRILPLVNDKNEWAGPLVKVSAGSWVTHVLCERVSYIAGREPARLRFIADDATLEIEHREAVIGIRNHRPTDTRLAGRRIGEVRFAVYAQDKSVSGWARVLGTTPSAQWVQAKPRTKEDVEITQPRNALDLALAGSCRAVLPTFIAAKFPQLERISPPITDLTHDQWLVTHHEDRFLPEVRSVINRTFKVLQENCMS